MSWSRFESESPELAEFGRERLHGKVAYLATLRANGAPRVHPVTPLVGAGRVFLFMEPTSPKGKDLVRDGRYALHCGMSDTSGDSGEFLLWGTARLVEDAETRSVAASVSSYEPAARYVLFELSVERAQRTVYGEDGPERDEWRAR